MKYCFSLRVALGRSDALSPLRAVRCAAARLEKVASSVAPHHQHTAPQAVQLCAMRVLVLAAIGSASADSLTTYK